jgi:sigma-B regulation protein RsbU (phosphoserine phosphatase)
VDEHPAPRDLTGDEALDDFYGALLDDDAEALYEEAPCGYLSTTPAGTIVKVNRTFLRWTGYERHDLVGRRTLAELLTAGGRIYHETHYAPMLHMQGTVREIALDVVRADGSRLPALVNSVLQRDEDGQPAIVRVAIFDATERRQYERELVRARRWAEESEARARVLAQTLQQTLLPPALPEIAGLDIAAAFRPAGTGEEIGGDFYDVFETGPGGWLFAVGDVQGKGAGAAVVASMVRYTIRAAAVRSAAPSEVLDTVNEVLIRNDTERFCTIVLAWLREVDGAWNATVSSGGHPLPLRAREGTRPTVLGRSDELLGVFGGVGFHDREVALRSGDALVMYTDGVTEGRRGEEWFGDARLEAAITRGAASATALTTGILDDVMTFQSGLPRDDIAVVAVRVP